MEKGEIQLRDIFMSIDVVTVSSSSSTNTNLRDMCEEHVPNRERIKIQTRRRNIDRYTSITDTGQPTHRGSRSTVLCGRGIVCDFETWEKKP